MKGAEKNFVATEDEGVKSEYKRDVYPESIEENFSDNNMSVTCVVTVWLR